MRRDLQRLLRNRGVVIPLMAAPIVVLVVLPILLVGGGDFVLARSDIPLGDPSNPLTQFAPSDAGVASAGVAGPGRWAAFILVSFLAPLYLLIPLIVSTVVAADSFAGEHERKTMEAVLHTPTDDRELLVGKFLAAWLPALVITIGGFVVYVLIANGVTWPQVGRLWFPTTSWMILAFWVAPGLAGLGLGLMVIVSSRVETLQSAHQIGSVMVLPIILLLIAQITGGVLLQPEVVFLGGTIVWLLALLTLRIGTATFTREQLARRL
ncbi:MAG: ABC transporter permease subunit [Nitriliruptorales bacterium]|nr:ABC transporter permease subunit [Nitriliruptorales bacterium]